MQELKLPELGENIYSYLEKSLFRFQQELFACRLVWIISICNTPGQLSPERHGYQANDQ